MNARVSESHGRVEHARQKLVAAEEKYLRAHGWTRQIYGESWLWVRPFPGLLPPELVVMERAAAVKFQHENIGDDR